MAGGNNDQMLNMGLMIAAGIAAPELAPALMEGGALAIPGLTSGAVATGITGATLGGAAGALTGQDVGRSAAMGGLGGVAAGYFGGVNPAESGSMLAAGPTTPGAGLSTLPTTIAPANVANAGLQTSLGNNAQLVSGLDLGNGAVEGARQVMPAAGSAVGGATSKAAMIGGGAAGINSLLTAPTVGAYVPPGSTYTGGNLSKFKYDPNTYQPDVVRPPSPVYKAQYAQNPYGYSAMAEGGIASLYDGGGTVEQMSRQNSLGNNQMFPQAGLGTLTNTNVYQNPINTPESTNIVGPTDSMTDPYSGQMQFAGGGIAQLAVGGKLLRGNGDGMSDSINANIDGRQQARLADGEFVIPADVVSHLGNGSTDAGAKQLYSMMDRVRHARVGNKKQGKQINPAKYMTA
jgi:hypothetical protein